MALLNNLYRWRRDSCLATCGRCITTLLHQFYNNRDGQFCVHTASFRPEAHIIGCISFFASGFLQVIVSQATNACVYVSEGGS